MRVLLDENLDWRLRRDLPEHQVESVPLIGWAGIENGELLRKAVDARFDVLLTMDNNMVAQAAVGASGYSGSAVMTSRLTDWPLTSPSTISGTSATVTRP
jgi:hypothetical protein